MPELKPLCKHNYFKFALHLTLYFFFPLTGSISRCLLMWQFSQFCWAHNDIFLWNSMKIVRLSKIKKYFILKVFRNKSNNKNLNNLCVKTQKSLGNLCKIYLYNPHTEVSLETWGHIAIFCVHLVCTYLTTYTYQLHSWWQNFLSCLMFLGTY